MSTVSLAKCLRHTLIPSTLMKECSGVLGSIILSMFNLLLAKS